MKVGRYLRKISKAEIWILVLRAPLDSMFELSGFVYIKNHVILHVKSKAEKVNLIFKTSQLSRDFLRPDIRHETENTS